MEFQRFVEYFNPGYVVVENVPGILSRMKESGLDNFIKLLEEKDLPSISVFTIRLITEFPKAVKDLR
ncbi:modification methylase [Neisseria gonorrhoeae]|uniref:Modification methylase n=1 Tax=Neisseria gonorrhoeae TaxID=485 RepID=A0A378VUV9_NEIGO|nr:modification methylase [Neisseria gonorrhoeae]